MTIFSRREEISMMKSIGADRYFIRGPFLIEAELYGIVAAIIATGLGMFIQSKLLASFSSYIEVSRTSQIIESCWPLILLILLAIGFLIGNLSARLALRRYLKNTRY